MLEDIDLIFGIWVYNDVLQIKFTFRSGPMIFGRVMLGHKSLNRNEMSSWSVTHHYTLIEQKSSQYLQA
jgi:hypothetical protein